MLPEVDKYSHTDLLQGGLAFWEANGNGWRRFIYVVRAEGDPPIKVGIANDVIKRLASLQTGNPRQLELLFAFPGSPEMEWTLHRSLADDRLVGEWFHGPSAAHLLEVLPYFVDWQIRGFEDSGIDRQRRIPPFREFPYWDWPGPGRRRRATAVVTRYVEPSPVDPETAAQRLAAAWMRPGRRGGASDTASTTGTIC